MKQCPLFKFLLLSIKTFYNKTDDSPYPLQPSKTMCYKHKLVTLPKNYRILIYIECSWEVVHILTVKTVVLQSGTKLLLHRYLFHFFLTTLWFDFIKSVQNIIFSLKILKNYNQITHTLILASNPIFTIVSFLGTL